VQNREAKENSALLSRDVTFTSNEVTTMQGCTINTFVRYKRQPGETLKLYN
jgi:hypothetical protein